MKKEEIRFEEVKSREEQREGLDNIRSSKRLRNKELARVTYFFVALFLVLMGYIAYFNIARARNIINSPYNARQDAFADRIVRGEIKDRNGNVLAETEIYNDGTEERNYPYGSDFAHVVGFSTAASGKAGLESFENFDLLTSDSFFIERLVNELKGIKNMGDTIATTLDLGLQQSAVSALGENRGAAVVMEPDTGKILAMASSPSFDPNEIEQNWDYLNSEGNGSPLLNRATQGLYAPGSTFKIVTALEYMRENADYENYTYDCMGEITNEGTTISCFGHTAHGLQDLRASMANSCNSSFANIGLSLDKEAYKRTAEELMFNQKLPSVLEYSKSRFDIDAGSDSAEMMMTAMGQGKTMVSPYHMALITAAVANSGILMTPYLVEKVTNHNGSVIRENMPKSYKKLMTAEEAAQLRNYMGAVVEEGTASLLSGQSYSVAGKTGTAEYSSDDGSKTHSWFTGFTNVDSPDLVITVVIENYDENAESKAVPIVKQILDSYY